MKKWIQIETIGPNVLLVWTQRARLTFSYSTPVAAFVFETSDDNTLPEGFETGKGYRTTERFSGTTARHISKHCSHHEPVSPERFALLLEKVA